MRPIGVPGPVAVSRLLCSSLNMTLRHQKQMSCESLTLRMALVLLFLCRQPAGFDQLGPFADLVMVHSFGRAAIEGKRFKAVLA